ncbi:MAG TPA: alpha/beta fold hydrolase [Aliidongia sp.]|nr:alpha/beta fold hydrolase [Aliidongia sp.]
MNPFYFGTAERRLFGLYEPAFKGTGKRGAVLCNPWGSEYLFAHRTMRQLAIKLSTAGFHTLRFDFFGTGDSSGDMIDADLDGWETDVGLAIDEIKDIVGATRVTLIGLRLGATIAARAARRRSKEVDALVLWDPVISGEEYLQQLGVAFKDLQHALSADTGKHLEILGFPLTEKFISDLQALNMDGLISAGTQRILVMLTERLPSHQLFESALAGRGAVSTTVEFMTAAHPWIENSANAGIVPVGPIQRIINWLE